MRLRARKLAYIEGSPLEVTVPQLLDGGGWFAAFGRKGPLILEIGLGKDPHLVRRAERDPEGLYVGLEYSQKKFDKVVAKALRSGVQNVRVLRADAVRVLGPLFEAESLSAVYILFPDPWPKKRHQKKRLIQRSAVSLLAKKMASGATLELRTDDTDYRQQMDEVLTGEPSFENRLVTEAFRTDPLEPEQHISTLFESKFRERGKTIYYLYYRKASRSLDEVAAPRGGC